MSIKKYFNKLENFIFGVGSIKMVKKELFNSILSLIVSISFFLISIINLSLNKKINFLLYLALSCSFLLYFISSASKYRTLKTLAVLTKGINRNEIKS